MNNGDSLEEETNDIFDNEWNKASNEAEKERIEKERNEVLSIRPRESLIDIIQNKERKSQERTEWNLGYRLNKFKNIQEDIEGIQSGLYCIGGDANTGKTAFLVNLFMDIIDSNNDVYGIYFSLDDNKNTILNRIIAMFSKVEINKIDKLGLLENEDEKNRIQESYDKVKELAKNQFDIQDISDTENFEGLKRIIEVKKSKNKRLVVAIDGLHNLETGSSSENIRVDNINRANQIKKIVDSFDIPVLTTVELRKADANKQHDRNISIHDINESGKFGYNANLVWMLQNKDIDSLESEEIDSAVTVNLIYAKNKLSHIRSTRALSFLRAYSHFSESVCYNEKVTFNAEQKTFPKKKVRV